MKPEKVDFYLNKRKEREREKKSEEDGEGGSSGTPLDVEQLPNRSPASEENIRTRVSPSLDTDPLEIKKEEH